MTHINHPLRSPLRGPWVHSLIPYLSHHQVLGLASSALVPFLFWGRVPLLKQTPEKTKEEKEEEEEKHMGYQTTNLF